VDVLKRTDVVEPEKGVGITPFFRPKEVD